MFLHGASTRYAVGIFADDTKIYVTEVEYDGVSMSVRHAVRAWCADGDGQEASSSAVRQAEALQMVCAIHGMQTEHMAWIYTRESGYVYEKAFPSLSARELASAVALDMEASCPYPEGGYWLGYIRQDDSVLAAALPCACAAELVDALDMQELDLDAMWLAPAEIPFTCAADGIAVREMAVRMQPTAAKAVWDEPQILSLYAGIALLRENVNGDIDFLPKKTRHTRFLRESFLPSLLAVWFAVLCGVYAVGAWQIHTLESEIQACDSEKAAHAPNYARTARLQAQEADTERVKTILTDLSAKRQSWYYILYTLGTVTMRDVYLTHWEMKQPHVLQCQGVAYRYERLLDYMQLLEENQEAFGARPRLMQFSTDADGNVRFLLELTYETEALPHAK